MLHNKNKQQQKKFVKRKAHGTFELKKKKNQQREKASILISSLSTKKKKRLVQTKHIVKEKKKKKSLHIISPTEAMLAQFNAYPGWLYIEICRA